MPSLNIPDELFQRLAERAAALHVTVEQLIAPLLELAAKSDSNGDSVSAPTKGPFADWQKKLDTWMADVQARRHRYPPEFVMDDSRDSIYEGCGE